MTKKQTIKAPATLAPATQRWFQDVAETYILESHHVRILELAGRSWDRAEEARTILAREGLTVTDGHGQAKPHPCVGIERDSQLRFSRLLREMALDTTPPPDSRPPRTGGQQH
jgi:phage terminase small subunit